MCLLTNARSILRDRIGTASKTGCASTDSPDSPKTATATNTGATAADRPLWTVRSVHRHVVAFAGKRTAEKGIGGLTDAAGQAHGRATRPICVGKRYGSVPVSAVPAACWVQHALTATVITAVLRGKLDAERPLRRQPLRIGQIDRIVAHIGIAVDPVEVTHGVALGEAANARVVVPRAVVDEPTRIGLSSRVAVGGHGTAAGEFEPEGVEPLGGGDRCGNVGQGQERTEPVRVVIDGGGARATDAAGEAGQRMIEAGLHVQRGGRGPTGTRVFAVEVLVVVEVIGGNGPFGLLDPPAPVVVAEAGGVGSGDLAQPIEAVEGVLGDLTAGTTRVIGPGDAAPLAGLVELATGIVQVGFEQRPGEAAVSDFGQLLSGVALVGEDSAEQVAEAVIDEPPDVEVRAYKSITHPTGRDNRLDELLALNRIGQGFELHAISERRNSYLS
jgi:hypothetical protein